MKILNAYIYHFIILRHSTTPMMSQAKLEKTLPLIENAAKILVQDLIKPGKEYDTKELSSAYTIKAIMSSGFSIGKILLSLTISFLNGTKLGPKGYVT